MNPHPPANPYDDLDRVLLATEVALLAKDDTLQPSSGFAASVMHAVREQAAEPPPISFPWPRALAGDLAALAVFIFMLVTLPSAAPIAASSQAGAGASSDFTQLLLIAASHTAYAPWISLAGIITLASLAYTLWLVNPRFRRFWFPGA